MCNIHKQNREGSIAPPMLNTLYLEAKRGTDSGSVLVLDTLDDCGLSSIVKAPASDPSEIDIALMISETILFQLEVSLSWWDPLCVVQMAGILSIATFCNYLF